MKCRLILRDPIIDSGAKCAGYNYTTIVIDVPHEKRYEVIGGEWLPDKEE